jgi:hypothetical protein
MLRLTAGLLIVLATQAAAQTKDSPPAIDLQGKLYRSVFTSGPGMLVTADVAKVPEPLRSRLTRYLARRTAFKSSYKNEATSWEMARTDAKKRALERAMVSLIEIPGIEKTAADFVAKAPVSYEWEGMHDGPVDEARYVEEALKADPASPLAPWFHVFIAQRQRVAFEAYESEKNEEGMKSAAKKYRAFVERARASEDPIFSAIIEDLERQPYLYLKTSRNPRDFDPDS